MVIIFCPMLDFLRTDKLILPLDMDIQTFNEEVNFYGFNIPTVRKDIKLVNNFDFGSYFREEYEKKLINYLNDGWKIEINSQSYIMLSKNII